MWKCTSIEKSSVDWTQSRIFAGPVARTDILCTIRLKRGGPIYEWCTTDYKDIDKRKLKTDRSIHIIDGIRGKNERGNQTGGVAQYTEIHSHKR